MFNTSEHNCGVLLALLNDFGPGGGGGRASCAVGSGFVASDTASTAGAWMRSRALTTAK
jgi:hypothetical protein